MPYNLSIPGQMTERELWTIEALAKLVPPDGVIVEVGSFLGLSSYTWAKSVHPSVTVYCIDPWDGNTPANAEFHRRHKVDFSLATFKNFVKNCPNIIPLPGYSPQDFLDWNQPIDLYFEDAVHKNPILHNNLEFWSRFIKPDGIICGHDYREKFPDVVTEVNQLRDQYGVDLITVDSVWCLPLRKQPQEIDSVAKNSRINGHQYCIQVEEYSRNVDWGDLIVIKGQIRNETGRDLEVWIDGTEILKIGIKVYQDQSESYCINLRESLGVDQFTNDSTLEFNIRFDTNHIQPGQITLEIDLVAEYWYWFKDKGAKPAIIDVQVHPKITDDETLDVHINDVSSWMRYVPSRDPNTSLGWRLLSSQTFQSNQVGKEALVCKTMLSEYELALLYMLTKDYYSGQGEILDLGPYLGLTTNILARGLSHNKGMDEKEKSKRIYSFDAFKSSSDTGFSEKEDSLTGSIFQKYLDLNRDYLDLLNICPGDLQHFTWTGALVEILFIDIAKTWKLNDWVIKQTFGSLIPGQSIVVQQDYMNFNEYWIHITMEYFQEYFELLYMLYGGSAVYRCVKPIPKKLLNMDLEKLPIEHKSNLLESARSKAPRSVQEVMKTAHAKCMIEHGHYEEAAALLKSVDTKPKTNDPVLNVAGIANSNLSVVNNLFKAATGKSAL